MGIATALLEEYVSAAVAASVRPFSIGTDWLERLMPLRPHFAGTFADVRIGRWRRLEELEAPARLLNAATAFAVHTAAAQLSLQLDAAGYEGSRAVLPYIGGAGRGDTHFVVRGGDRILVSAYDLPAQTALPMDFLVEADAWLGRDTSCTTDEEIATARTAVLVSRADDTVSGLPGWVRVMGAEQPHDFFTAIEAMRPELEEAAT